MSKKKSGSYKTPSIKSSNLLPQVFNTDVNKKWLDSTLDQMISKGSLKNVEGYIGDKSGNNRSTGDVYLENGKLDPAIVVTDTNNKLVDAITMDDIANSINTNFSEYNYNTAYATKSYSYRPPINIHKFIDYQNYAWVDQMPIYESIRTLDAATVGSVTSGSSYPANPSHGDYFALNDGVNTKTYQWDDNVKTWQPSGTTDAVYTNNNNNAGFTSVVNPVEMLTNQLTYTITDNNNTFDLADQMLIKFVGDGWHADSRMKTYLVTGTGKALKLINIYSWPMRSTLYPDTTKTTVTVGGLWDKSKIIDIDPNWASKLFPVIVAGDFVVGQTYRINNTGTTTQAEWNTTAGTSAVTYVVGDTFTATDVGVGTGGAQLLVEPSIVKQDYNTDVNRLPIFDGFIFPSEESNKTQFIEGELISFSDRWTLLDKLDYHRIWYTTVDNVTGNIDFILIVDAQQVSTSSKFRQFIVPGTNETVWAKYKDRLKGFDTQNYDKSTVIFTEKDYQVIETDSPFKTAWSRNNKWTSINTLKKINELIYGGINIEELTETKFIAKRPIIEFDGKLNMWAWANYSPELGDNHWTGVIDFMVKPVGDYAPTVNVDGNYQLDLSKVEIIAGQKLAFTEGDLANALYQIDNNGVLTEDISLVENNCAYVREALPDTEDTFWSNSDVFYDGTKWNTGQQRTAINQMPLFKLYTVGGLAVEQLKGGKFQGSRLFNYKIGTGTIDPELSIPLSYKDINGIGQYEFENYLFTETQFQSITSQFNKDANYHRQVIGQNLFKADDKLTNLYKQSEEISGAETLETYDVDSVSSDFTINIGHSSWRTDRRIALHQQDKRCVVTEIQNGVYLDKANVDHTNIYIGKAIPVVFSNLLEGNIEFKTVSGTVINTNGTVNVPGIKITQDATYDNNYKLEIDNYDDKIIIDPVDATLTNDYAIIPLDNYDSIQHTVEVNGKLLSANNYELTANTIVIPNELLNVGDIVDLKYASNNNTNRTTNSSLPNTLKHNPNNEVLKTFTMGETLTHWQSIITSTPGFEGDVFGVNNYDAINKQHYFGGQVFIHTDLSIVHDALYANDSINITNALATAGEDWDNFKNRFRSQVARLYETKTYNSIKDLVDDTIKAVTVTRQGGELFKTSNMVYTNSARLEKFVWTDDLSMPRIFLKDNMHSDDNIQDHVYVYITEWYVTKLETRLLVKDVDYRQAGSLIEFTFQPTESPTGIYPTIIVHHHAMDSASYVPPSLTKLKLASGMIPTWNIAMNTLVGHDGTQWNLGSGAKLFDMNSESFDVINACQFELEKRIYSGLVISDRINTDDACVESLQYGFTSKFIPNVTRETWYTLETINDMMYKSFTQWKEKNKRSDIKINYVASDKDTWNFSSVTPGGRFGTNKLPGQWKGAYEVLFGTSTPHLTPWHMLGYAFKPSWWFSKYSWTVPSKRDALIKALKRGQVSTSRQDIEWANHMWDWDTKCPVNTSGGLVDVETILDPLTTLTSEEKGKRFTFGDYAGLEAEWRNSASGKAALIDAIVKLNPTKASSIFYSPSLRVTDKQLDYLNKDNLNTYTTSSIATPGKVYGRVVSDVEIKTIDRFPTNTFVRLVGADGSVDAEVTLAFDNRQSSYPAIFGTLEDDGKRYVVGASLSQRGRNLTTLPAVYTDFNSAQIETSTFEFKTKEVEYVASGIVQALYNYTLRNNIDYNLDNLHTRINTHLSTQLRGFSSKHLLDFKTQTYDDTNHTLGENDFALEMYKSTPINVAIASSITVEWLQPGWKISGSGYGKQEFNFFAPDNTNSTSFENVDIVGTQVKKYKKFAPTHSILEYNAKLDKIQDVYSFIRGYYAYLESIGFVFPYAGDSVAASFAKWALTNPKATKTFDLGNNFKFSPTHGNVMELNTGVFKENTIADTTGTTIDSDNLLVARVENTLSLETKDNTIIGSAGFVVVEYEHIALLNDKTNFGVVVYDNVKNIIQEKIRFRGLITDKWDGNKRAPGYLVFDNKIVENFDSSVQAVDDYYRTDGIDFNPSVRKLEDITIGNSNNELTISSNEFDSITRRNYYQGLIKQRGTSSGLDKIERRFIDDKLDIKVHEQYMLSRSYFGNTDRLKAVEFTLENNSFETSPQAIKFSAGTVYNDVLVYAPGDKRFVNPFEGAANYTTQPIKQVDISNLTAGSLLDAEAKYKVNLLNEISNVYEPKSDYGIIETWADNKSYKLNNLVRYRGALYQCNIDSTTVSVSTDNIEITGNKSFPEFDYDTSVIIDGSETILRTTSTTTNIISELGSVMNPVVLAPTIDTTLTIDDVPVSLTNKQEVDVVTGPAVLDGSAINPAFDSSNGYVTGKTITINGYPVDFDTTPVDVTENILGVAAQQTYTISQALSGTTYSVSSVTVDGTANTDFTVSGQDITFNNPTFAGSEAIVVTLTHIAVGMTTAEIVTKINDTLANSVSIIAGEPNAILADVTSDNRIRIRYWATVQTNLLTLSLSTTGTNSVLGFKDAGETDLPSAEKQLIEQDMDLDAVVIAINNTPGLPTYISASNDSNQLRLVSAGGRTQLTIGGSQRAVLGFQILPYDAGTSTTTGTTDLAQAVAAIKDKLEEDGITGVTVSDAGNFLNITSTNPTLTLPASSTDSFLVQAGITKTGVISQITNDTLENTFVSSEWTNISHTDPALFNIWVANDSDYEVKDINGITTKHFGWNVLQVQNKGLYTADLQNNAVDEFTRDEPCGICAGAATADGNDAQITVHVNHGLKIGDYVMVLNTTTTPNIDGIHKVTKIKDSTTFYIDQYIDKCGSSSSIMTLRPTRFTSIEDRNAALQSDSWNVSPTTNIFTDFDKKVAEGRTRSINVFKTNYSTDGEGYLAGKLAQSTAPEVEASQIPDRSQLTRITNTDLDNITVYDYETNTPILDLELFDPMRGIIPGVADAEIDIKSVHDIAIYNTSTEEEYETDDDSAWANAEIGKRWWDTSKVRYYDYDQGDLKDKTSNWAKQFVGSEIVIWEWTKSSVAPDDYAKAVASNKVMFGVPASGTAYAEFDVVKNQNEYYYTLRSEWNAANSKYESVYYFWVRNKETIGSTDKNIITSEVENIITDPSANGIYWFSVVDSDAIIISDIWDFVNKKVVVQLNKKVDNSHAQWILVGKDTDIIPTHWYTGLKSNLASIDEDDLRIPDFNNHEYARYGDDRANRQAWFDDIVSARKNALDIINRLLVSVNVYNDFRSKFFQSIIDNGIPNDTWEWTDYIEPEHNFSNTYTKNVTNIEELESLDTTEYQTARIEIFNDDNVDRTEFYRYTTTGWVLSKKRNATINWIEERLAKSYTWDMEPWDSVNWSSEAIADWWKGIVQILRDVVFVNEHTHKFNKFFFGMIDYAMSRTKQVEWAMKTSYIRLEVKSDFKEVKKYKKDMLSTIEGYVNDVKPFHVKISETSRTFNKQEEVSFAVTEEHKSAITIKADTRGTNFNELVLDANNELEKTITLVNNGTSTYVIPETDADMTEWNATLVKDGVSELVLDTDYFLVDQTIGFASTPLGTVTVTLEFKDPIKLIGGDSQTNFIDINGVDGFAIVDGGNGLQPEYYTLANNDNKNISTDADIRPQETAIIKVQTNRSGSTDTTETRTFAYMLDINKYQHVYGMEDAKTSTLSADLNISDTVLAVADPSKFATAELVLVNNEVIQVQTINNILYIRKRGLNLTFANKHTTGTTITDVTGNALHYVTSSADRRFNDDNTTILDSSASAEAVMLNRIGKGTIL
jgi:hypothetical protein